MSNYRLSCHFKKKTELAIFSFLDKLKIYVTLNHFKDESTSNTIVPRILETLYLNLFKYITLELTVLIYSNFTLSSIFIGYISNLTYKSRGL